MDPAFDIPPPLAARHDASAAPATRHPLRIARLCSLLTLAASGAWAQHATDAQALASLPLDSLLDVEVSGASKFSQPVRSAPSSVTVISAADIRALGFRSLAEVLRTVRGLNVNSDRAYAYLGVRGIAAPGDYNTRVLLLIDGNRINDAVYDQAYLGSEFPLDLDLVERVEFMPGPGSAVHGANALFGVVNVVTRQDLGNARGSASVTLGSGAARTTSGSVIAGVPGSPQLLVSASRHLAHGDSLYFPQYDQPGVGNGISRGTDWERQSRLFMRFDGANGLSATFLHADREKGASAFPVTVFGDRSTRMQDIQSHSSLQWTGRIRPEVELTVRGYASRYSFIGDYLLAYEPPTRNRDTVEARSYGTELRAVVSAWSGHKVVLGSEFQSTPHRDQGNFDLSPRVDYLNDRQRGRRASLFAEDQWQLSPEWSLALGGRYDETRTDGGNVSPRLGAVWQASPQWVFKYLYGDAYRPANAFERYYAVPGDGGYVANPRLKSEHTRGHELAAEYRPSSALKWSASVYRNEVTDLIVQQQDAQIGQNVFTNVAPFSTRGLELEAEALLPYHARLRANASFQQSNAGASLTGQSARRLGNLTLLLPLPAGWTVGLVGSAVGRRAQAPGFGVADLTLSNAAPWRKWRVAFSIYNLLDRRASDPSVDPGMPGTIPHDGRGGRVSFDVRF